MSEKVTYVFEREFQADVQSVWQAMTTPEKLAHWYGPGVETHIHKFDLEVGGLWLNEMRWGEKSDYSKMEFRELQSPTTLEWRQSSTDKDWNDQPSQMMENWPQFFIVRIELTDKEGVTALRLSMRPDQATKAELACFEAAMSNMDNGWGAGFKLLAEMVESS
ncbi:MAG: SRPBCC domain-containing protein [Pseudomonadota bacterium]